MSKGTYGHVLVLQSRRLVRTAAENDFVICCMDTDSFIINIKTEDIYEDIADDVEKRFDSSNYEVNRPLPTGKNKKFIGLMKD